jgi:hypothetical protein
MNLRELEERLAWVPILGKPAVIDFPTETVVDIDRDPDKPGSNATVNVYRAEGVPWHIKGDRKLVVRQRDYDPGAKGSGIIMNFQPCLTPGTVTGVRVFGTKPDLWTGPGAGPVAFRPGDREANAGFGQTGVGIIFIDCHAQDVMGDAHVVRSVAAGKKTRRPSQFTRWLCTSWNVGRDAVCCTGASQVRLYDNRDDWYLRWPLHGEPQTGPDKQWIDLKANKPADVNGDWRKRNVANSASSVVKAYKRAHGIKAKTDVEIARAALTEFILGGTTLASVL